MERLKEHYGKLGKINILPNFLVDDPYLTVDVVMEPRVFTSGQDNQYQVTVGFTSASIVMDHPGYETSGLYAATVAPEIWKASVSSKTNMETSGSVEGGTGFSLFGWLRTDGKAAASASKSKASEIAAEVPYPIIQPTVEGWTIGGIHGDPRYSKDNVGDKAGLLQGAYFKGDKGEDSAAEKNVAGRPKNASLHYRDGANSLKIVATLTAPKSALCVRIKYTGNAMLQDGVAEQDHANELKEALIKLCVARDMEMSNSRDDGNPTRSAGSDQVFLDCCEKLGQRPAKAKR